MAISVTCGQCFATINAVDDLAGTSAKCPKCRATIDVPAASEELSQADAF